MKKTKERVNTEQAYKQTVKLWVRNQRDEIRHVDRQIRQMGEYRAALQALLKSAIEEDKHLFGS